jgi:farnesyl-diphosphate farnesyltransferase
MGSVSRSFAAVTEQLPSDLRDTICIFYLVLRALDTIEDDTTIPRAERIAECPVFYKHLEDRKWTKSGCGSGDYAVLLEQFHHVTKVYARLHESHRRVISDITRQMGEGMTVFLRSSDSVTVKSMADWDQYCHYVAGLVGFGLSRLFAASEHEDPKFGTAELEPLSNSMGLFLQKVNIIRDYLEDLDEERMFWPADAYRKYCTEIKELAKPEKRKDAVKCLNELITHALHHAPDCLTYLSMLQNKQVLTFCAIPQVMAIATIAACYNNPRVFEGPVKIRKGMFAKLVLEARSMPAIYRAFYHFASDIMERVPVTDPSAKDTLSICKKIKDICAQHVSVPRRPSRQARGLLSPAASKALVVAMAAVSMYVVWTQRGRIMRKVRQLTGRDLGKEVGKEMGKVRAQAKEVGASIVRNVQSVQAKTAAGARGVQQTVNQMRR